MMETVVISLGGSVIVPDSIDYNLLKQFKKVVSADKRKFVIVAGGGKVARNYISALKNEGASNSMQDLIGIEITRLNAKLVAGVLNLPFKIPETCQQAKQQWKKQRIVVSGGFRPGITTDGVGAEIAKAIGAKTFINYTNVDGVYTKDPKLKGAKFIPEISYSQFNKMLAGVKEGPGMHFILDKHAAKIVEQNKIKVIILSGMDNLKAYLEGRKFKGTVIN
jgi:uridylate kinase